MTVIRGWRTWHFNSAVGKLASVSIRGIYWDSKFMKAVCRASDNTDYDPVWVIDSHAIPALSGLRPIRNTLTKSDYPCGCGIYVFKESNEAKNLFEIFRTMWDNCIPVIGTVTIWGRVIEHKRGYRSEYAEIEQLWVPANFADIIPLLENVYEVPVGVDDGGH